MSEQTRPRKIFITGGTGYLGRHLIPRLVARGHTIRGLVRESSTSKLAEGCEVVIGNALDKQSYHRQIQPADTFVHLVGVSRPNPLKAEQFRKTDLKSVQDAVEAAVKAKIQHFVYVSVAHPAPVMKAYISARVECEKIIRESGLNATVLRPWYILGPGHWWPYAMIPFYKILEQFPLTAEISKRLGLVKLHQMVCALKFAVENPCTGGRIWAVDQIRNAEDLIGKN